MNEQVFLNGAPVVGFGDAESELAHERATAPATIAGFFVGAIGGAVLGNVVHKGAVGATVGTIVGGVGGLLGGNLLASYALRKPPQRDCESLSADERTAAFNKAKANLEAAGTPFDASWMSDPNKFGAFMAEVSRVAGCTVTPPAPTPSSTPKALPPATPAPVTPTPATTSGWHPVQANSVVNAGQRIAVAVAGIDGVPLPPEFVAQGTRMFEEAAAGQPGLHAIAYPPGSLLPLDWPSDDDLGPGAFRYMVDAPITAPLTSSAELPTPGVPEMGVMMTFRAWVRDKS
jgi:hypothetical protein